MFFQMATRRDPMAAVRAFIERAEAARHRPLAPAAARPVVEGAFGTGSRSPGPRLVVTREDMDRENRQRHSALLQNGAPRSGGVAAYPGRRNGSGGPDEPPGDGQRAAAAHVAPTPILHRTQGPTPFQRAFLKEQLARRRLPTNQIDHLRFVSGLDSNANFLTRTAFHFGAAAVTQGSTVYVQPDRFDDVANFRSPTGFEEAYHTAQFALDDSFYPAYAILSAGGLISVGDAYRGNAYEAFAKGASRQMFEEYRSRLSRR